MRGPSPFGIGKSDIIPKQLQNLVDIRQRLILMLEYLYPSPPIACKFWCNILNRIKEIVKRSSIRNVWQIHFYAIRICSLPEFYPIIGILVRRWLFKLLVLSNVLDLPCPIRRRNTLLECREHVVDCILL